MQRVEGSSEQGRRPEGNEGGEVHREQEVGSRRLARVLFRWLVSESSSRLCIESDTNAAEAEEAKGFAVPQWTRVKGASIVQREQPDTLVSRIQRRLDAEGIGGGLAKVTPREFQILQRRLRILQRSGKKFQHVSMASDVAGAAADSRYLGGLWVATEV